MKSLLIPFLFIFLQIINYAQMKNFTMKEVVIDSYTTLKPKDFNQFDWINENEYFTIDENVLYKSSINAPKIVKITNLLELDKKINEDLIVWPKIKFISDNEFIFNTHKYGYKYNISDNSVSKQFEIPETADEFLYSPDYKYLAYHNANSIFYVSEEGTEPIAISYDKNIVYSKYIHRNEFGISNGMFWSPSSKKIAFYRKDESNVKTYPLVDHSTYPAKEQLIKYPMAGQENEIVKVGIFSLDTKETIYLETGDNVDQYLVSVSWSLDEKYIILGKLNRSQNHLKVYKYDANTGKEISLLFEEKDNEYVEPMFPAIFVNENQFIWTSERDGYQHLYLYNIDGSLVKQITKGKWVVKDLLKLSDDKKYIFIEANKHSPISSLVYKVNLDSNEVKLIGTERGIHKISINNSSNFFIDSYSSLETPRIVNIIDDNSNIVKNLLTSENPIKYYSLGDKKVFTIKNDDNIDLYCRMIYPPDFNMNKKYPVIFYMYGGFHSQTVEDDWEYGKYDFWTRYMASKGYIIFTLDNRGTAGRGVEFEQATYGKLGTIEVQDHLAGVEYLKTLPYIDLDRFGVYGWSYGGFLSTSLMLKANNVFKVGVAGGPVIDWKLYEMMYTERYMNTPQLNPEGYEISNLLNYVDQLKGKLLIVHGTEDRVVVWQNSLLFAQECVKKIISLDYFPYLGYSHHVTGNDKIHLYTKITNYFLDNL